MSHLIWSFTACPPFVEFSHDIHVAWKNIFFKFCRHKFCHLLFVFLALKITCIFGTCIDSDSM